VVSGADFLLVMSAEEKTALYFRRHGHS